MKQNKSKTTSATMNNAIKAENEGRGGQITTSPYYSAALAITGIIRNRVIWGGGGDMGK